MRPVLLIDFGSTYTKVTAVDLDGESILGTATSLTTAATDIGVGLEAAVARLEEKTGRLDYVSRRACSSAAGGLGMMVSGLVPELTAQAAKEAALGAGARIRRIFSYELSRRDLAEIEAEPPDIFLLTGGTDGGNRDCIIGNAGKLAGLTCRFPLILAGNRSAIDECESLLADFPLTVCPNVMPRLGQLNIEPVQKEIRSLFLSHIVGARGLTRTQELLSGILMPTPSAILSAMNLLSRGTAEEEGLGDLLAVDVGGATTDVYSIGSGQPDDANIIVKGLEEPLAKRTVEGDIGVRHSIPGIVEETGLERLACDSGLEAGQIEDLIHGLSLGRLLQKGQEDQLCRLDHALAAAAVEVATKRHAGKLEEVYTPMGLTWMQTGKNLRPFRQLVLTGGALVHAGDPLAIAKRALYDESFPRSLRPYQVEVFLDRRYILSAMGVLAESEPDKALRIIKKELTGLGPCGRKPGQD